MVEIKGFSKLSKMEKLNFLVSEYLGNSKYKKELITSFWHEDKQSQKIFDEFSENTITNFYLPYGIVPNVKINDELFCVPMVTEESSVVAAASKSAKYWLKRGGFKAEVISTTKVGQVHFIWKKEYKELEMFFAKIKNELLEDCSELTDNMKERGGGLIDIKLIDKTADEKGYFQLWADFETCDAMGANFINSVLEKLATSLESKTIAAFGENSIQIIMSILSNYTPDCIVKASVECPINELVSKTSEIDAKEFAEKFSYAVKIAKLDPYRATTHNKGIFNGIDSVVLATGNDFRAVEACGHAYAARDGQYRGLTDCEVDYKKGIFKFSLKIPMSLGTVGGLTALHPMAQTSLDILNRPSAKKLMMVVATIGLAQNFAALRSLVTSGIQKGHMKMHLMNILNHLEANNEERDLVKEEFDGKTISFSAVKNFLGTQRNYQ